MIKRRNMGKQVLLYIVTFGIYGIYWFYVTSKEVVEYKGLGGRPGLWTVLLFVPLVNFYAYWKHSKAVEALTDGRYGAVLIFVLWIFVAPAVWAITQIELNNLATEGPEPATEVSPPAADESPPATDESLAVTDEPPPAPDESQPAPDESKPGD
ncbi:MAG: DUF4234 domain-containing protein [Dehalococcoidia bacterium]